MMLAKRVFIIIALLLLVFQFSLPTAQAAPQTPLATIRVTTPTDEYGEDGDDSLCSLREAIQTANEHSSFGGCAIDGTGSLVITIPAGTYSLTRHGSDEDDNASGDLDIRVPVTLNGAGADATIIRGDGDMTVNDRVLHIVSNPDVDFAVTLSNLAVTNGYVAEEYSPVARGGGILSEESLSINNVAIYENYAEYGGGGVACFPIETVEDEFLYAYSSSVTDNSSDHYFGGGILFVGYELVLDHVEVSGNSGNGAGGIFAGGMINTITWTSVHGNTAGNDGGGLIFAQGDLTLEDSSLYNNTTGGDGGNLYLYSDYGSTATVTRCYIGEGHAPNGAGAGIYSNGQLTLSSSTVTLNTGDSAAGLYFGNMSLDPVSIFDSTIVFNNTDAPTDSYGNGLYNWQNNYDVQIRNTILASNGNPAATIFNNCQFVGAPERLISLGNNLESMDTCGFTQAGDMVNIDPLLGELDYHGGSSLNYALEDLSPAFEAGGDCLSTDQRGFSRPADYDQDGVALCDIGAIEAQPYVAWFPLITRP